MRKALTILLALALAVTSMPVMDWDVAYAAENNTDENSFRYSDGEEIPEDEVTEDADKPSSDRLSAKVSRVKSYKSDSPAYSGIDISYHQGTVDFSLYATGVSDSSGNNHAVQFVILRCGITKGSASSGYSYEKDTKFDEYAAACEANGIPYGVYYYSRATSDTMLAQEVAVIKDALSGKNVSLPVFLDMENNSVITTLSKSDSAISAIALSYANMMSTSGYAIGIYASTSYWYNYLDTFASKDISCYHWVAQYANYCAYGDATAAAAYNKYTYQTYHTYQAWQYSIAGEATSWIGTDTEAKTYVDLDYWYGEHILSATQSGAGITVKWYSMNKSAGYTYTLYRRDNSSGSWSDWTSLGTVSGNSYSDSAAVQNDVSYQYKISATASDGTVTESDAIGIGINENLAATTLTYKKADTGITLNWSYVNSATGYYVWKRTSGSEWEKIKDITSGSNLTYTDTSLTEGCSATYCVQAYSATDLGIFDPYGTTVIYPVSENAKGGIKVTWGAVYGTSVTYSIYRKEGSSSYELIDTVADASYKDKTVTGAEKYKYKIVANITYSDGTILNPTSFITKKLYYVKATKIKTLKSTAKKSFEIKWKKISTATGYEIEYSRKKSMTNSSTVKVTSYKTVSRRFTSLVKKKYFVRMRCYLKVGKKKYYSAWTAIKKVKIK